MRADRLLTLILLLQTRGKMTARRLAEELGVSRRTILRDLDALSLAGVPVFAEGGHGGGIALDENYRTSLAGLQEKEVRSLFVASNAQLLREVGLGEAAESTLLKLLAALPRAHQPTAEHIRQRILIDPVWWWREAQPPAFWAQLQQAVYEDRRIRAVYERQDGEVVERELEPYSLVAKSSVWYLIAQRAGELRTYRVSRFHQITLLETHFRRRDDFDLASHWQTHLQEFIETVSEYHFTLRIHPDRVNFARWLLPGRCQLEEPAGEDGWVTAHFHVDTLDLARMLVFGLGVQARVVEPKELRDSVVDGAGEILKTHAG
jgi:predicted DNA-binding transcriptional regulator YafY